MTMGDFSIYLYSLYQEAAFYRSGGDNAGLTTKAVAVCRLDLLTF